MSPTHVKIASLQRQTALPVFLLLVLAAAAVRAFAIFTPALWFDEAFSIYYVRKGLGAIWGSDWHLEPTPPVYYSLLFLWSKMFGQAEPVLRALSLVASSLATGMIYLTGVKLSGQRAGVGAALLWAVLPLAVDYGLEIRAYAIEFLGISFLTWAFVTLAQDLTLEKASQNEVVRHTAIFFSAGLFVSYTHITAVLAFASYCCVALIIFWRRRRQMLLVFLTGALLYCIALAPQVYASIRVMTGNAPTLAWLISPGLIDVLAVVRAMLVGNMAWGDWTARVILVIWVSVSLLALARLVRDDRHILGLTLGVAILAFLIFILFSRLQPVMLNRTALWMMIPAILFIAAGLAKIPTAPSTVAFATLLLACGFAARASIEVRNAQRGDWRGIREVARDVGRDGLIVTVDGELACEFDFFEPYLTPQIRLADLAGAQEFQRTQRVNLSCNQPPSIRADDLQRDLPAGQVVWLVGRTPFYENGARMYRDIEGYRGLLTSGFEETRRLENYSFIAIRMARRH